MVYLQAFVVEYDLLLLPHMVTSLINETLSYIFMNKYYIFINILLINIV